MLNCFFFYWNVECSWVSMRATRIHLNVYGFALSALRTTRRIGQPWHSAVNKIRQPCHIWRAAATRWNVSPIHWGHYALLLKCGADFRAPLSLTISFIFSLLSLDRRTLLHRIFEINECDRSRFRIEIRSIFRRGVSAIICCATRRFVTVCFGDIANCRCSFSRLATISRISPFSRRIVCKWITDLYASPTVIRWWSLKLEMCTRQFR